ncbi:hypothetical protein G7Y79_00131g102040 [Physcia stellaris]|nr:hypothetical protein G7Y79_00131g102040 [Physcia stellaris]
MVRREIRCKRGRYCHRSNPNGAFGDHSYENYVFFSDEMTPRYEYTWGGGNFFLAASIRTYCYAHCYCNSVGKSKTSRRNFTVWQMLRNHQLVLHGDGSIDYGTRRPLSRGVYHKIADILPAQDPKSGPGGGTAGTCGADGKQFCPAPWPKELGAIPRAPPFSTQILPPAPGQRKDMTVCGNMCESNKDCSSSLDFYACDCAYPTAEDARVLGLDPVAPPSVCLALDRVLFGMLGGLSGRDLDGAEVDGEKVSKYVDEGESVSVSVQWYLYWKRMLWEVGWLCGWTS